MFVKRASWTVFALVVAASLTLSACGGGAQPATQPATEPGVAAPTQAAPGPEVKPTETKPPQAKVATFIFTQEFDTLNPAYTNQWFSTITHQLWECWAWDFDEKNQPRPVLVTEIPSTQNGGISADGKVITLKLRSDLVWSDGEPLTSEDFVFTANMHTDPKNAVATAYPYDQLASIEAPDKGTVVLTFKEPFASWAGTLWKGLLPSHILKPVFEKDGTLDNAEWNRNPTVGCGPFVLDKWESGSYARFVANDKYWLGKPKIDQIFIRFVPDDASQIAALKAGDGDLGTFIAYPDIPGLEEAGVQIVTAYSGYNEGWYMYLDPKKGNPALQDVRVRQAIALAFDRFSLTKDLLLGLTQPAATFWDNTPYTDPSIQPWPYDPEKAKALLDEAGWKDTNGDGTRDKNGVELVLTYGTVTREIRQDTQAVAQQQLAQVGIKVELSNYESDIFFGTYGEGGPAATGKLDISQWSDTPYAWPDPDIMYWRCSEIPSSEKPQGVNWQAICDPELDNLFKLQASQVDFAARQKTFQQISKLMYDKVYWLGLWQDPDQWAIGKRLTNVKISGVTPFFNVMDWDMVQ
jgi:peptide/nickel transport system substrate-binding protein